MPSLYPLYTQYTIYLPSNPSSDNIYFDVSLCIGEGHPDTITLANYVGSLQVFLEDKGILSLSNPNVA